jgi:hypothetical protein
MLSFEYDSNVYTDDSQENRLEKELQELGYDICHRRAKSQNLKRVGLGVGTKKKSY